MEAERKITLMDWPLMGQPCNVFGQEPNSERLSFSVLVQLRSSLAAKIEMQKLQMPAYDTEQRKSLRRVIKKGDLVLPHTEAFGSSNCLVPSK